MYKAVKPFFLTVETSLHMGSGEELGIVDLPIQREKHTNFPKLEASGLKGCIRKVFRDRDGEEKKIGEKKISPADKEWKQRIELCFGPEPESSGDKHAGALAFTDGRLLLFPVKSMKGVFAWVTSRQVISRLQTDLEIAEVDSAQTPPLPEARTVPETSELFVDEDEGDILLEEYSFSVEKDQCTSCFSEWISERVFPEEAEYPYWKEKVKNDLVVLSDDAFCDFVSNSTEVITRIRIDPETGTVKEGLFTEEYLPCDSIVYSLAMATPLLVEEDTDKKEFSQENFEEEELVMQYFEKFLPSVIQLGGNATIGKGLVRPRIWKEGVDE